MFDTTKLDLKKILEQVDSGTLQLPDFQRDYVWADEDVKSLIASVAKGFPVGALLTLETGGEVQFKPRLLEGVASSSSSASELLLDGQQRMTSLYQSIFSKKPVRTRTAKGTEVERYYYLDIRKALDSSAELFDAIVGVPSDKVLRSNFGRTINLDLSTPEGEFENNLFPLNQVFDSKPWFYAWHDYWKQRDQDVYDMERAFDLQVLDVIQRYEMPIIRLDKKNSREAICLVFEKVNVGGKKLDAFELVTAIYAASNFDLRLDWSGTRTAPGRHARMIGSPNRRDVLTEIASTDFLQACTLLHTRKIRLQRYAEGLRDRELPQVLCNRDALLALPLYAYKEHADAVEAGFIEAAGFLNELKIIWNKDVPYPPLVVGLACVFAILGHAARSAAAKQKLAQWFWSMSLGELYGSSTESRLARDVTQLVDWIGGAGARPASVDESYFQQERLTTLRMRISAAYKAIHALLMTHGCRDFITGKSVDIMTFFNDNIDIHHIFPQKWCKEQRIDPGVFNSIVNKTPLSKHSNIVISGDAPSVYLKRIEAQQGITASDLDDILRTHLIEPAHLRNDDFDAFFKQRLQALTPLVADAMGKPVAVDLGSNEEEVEPPFDPEEELVAEVAG